MGGVAILVLGADAMAGELMIQVTGMHTYPEMDFILIRSVYFCGLDLEFKITLSIFAQE